MIFLNNFNIHQSITYDDIIAAMDTAILANETKEVLTPQRTHINLEKNTLLMMPCFGKKYFSVKLVSVFPDNTEKDIPTIFGTVILNDKDTGKPLALLDGKTITALRTGAIGGLSVKYLTPISLENIGVLGTGTQGLHQALFACTVRKHIKNVYLLNRSIEKLAWFQKEFKLYFPNIKLHIVKDSTELLQHSELVITASTSPTPLFPNEPGLLKDKHFLSIGSYQPDMRELPDAVFSLVDKVYVDTFHAIEESGDLVIPLKKKLLHASQISTLAHHIQHQIPPPQKTKTSIFKSVGLATFDLFAAALVYEKAIEKGIGQKLNENE